MTTLSMLQHVYPAEDGNAVIVCPHCKKHRSINAEKYLDTHKPLKVQCGCGCMFPVMFETREFYRKETHLSGYYTKSDTDDPEIILIEDLSFTGLKFTTRFSHDIEFDDVLKVVFVLDNRQASRIVKMVRVKYVHKRVIGAEFRDHQAYSAELTYYLSPD